MKMAVRRLVSGRLFGILLEHTFFNEDSFGFLAARMGAVYSESLGRA
jgi:hypothetical protein